jgi:hypothetical protein
MIPLESIRIRNQEVAVRIHAQSRRTAEQRLGREARVPAETRSPRPGNRRNHSVDNLTNPVVVGIGDIQVSAAIDRKS